MLWHSDESNCLNLHFSTAHTDVAALQLAQITARLWGTSWVRTLVFYFTASLHCGSSNQWSWSFGSSNLKMLNHNWLALLQSSLQTTIVFNKPASAHFSLLIVHSLLFSFSFHFHHFLFDTRTNRHLSTYCKLEKQVHLCIITANVCSGYYHLLKLPIQSAQLWILILRAFEARIKMHSSVKYLHPFLPHFDQAVGVKLKNCYENSKLGKSSRGQAGFANPLSMTQHNIIS